MRLLELFSGTKSVSKAVGHLYEEIISLDVLNKNNPTIVCDILSWDYKQYPQGHFDAIWASPPCTEYSKAKTVGIRNLDLANNIVKRTLEIIQYFNPDKWFIENPATGLLKNQEFMEGIPYYDVDYCQYGKDYRKRTRIWTMNTNFEPKLCNKKTCTKVVNNKHIASCGNGYSSDIKTTSKYSGTKYTNKLVTKDEKYSIPEQLIKDLFN
jgi:hypothetical protein